MRTSRWTLIGTTCLLVASPTALAAQKAEAEDFVKDVVMQVFGPHWNVFGNVGAATNGRFLLQSLPNVGGAQRDLGTATGFNLGIGAGVDILLRTGFRASYSYSQNDMVFRTDSGDGSRVFDMDKIVQLQSHVAAVEVTRYMLPARAAITPFASLGFVGAWWVLDEGSTVVVPTGGSTQFRPGALISFGLQSKLNAHLSTRLDVAIATVNNPFTGNESYRVTGGTILDEPMRVKQTDFRLAFVYHFSRPNLPTPGLDEER